MPDVALLFPGSPLQSVAQIEWVQGNLVVDLDGICPSVPSPRGPIPVGAPQDQIPLRWERCGRDSDRLDLGFGPPRH